IRNQENLKMLSLIIYNPAFGQPSGSPFCTKALCLLQMSGVKWKPEYSNDPRSAPMAKFPVLRDGETLIADSSIIQKYLEEHHGADFGSWLSKEQQATGHALVRMAEEHLYFHIVNDRWGRDKVWKRTMPVYFEQMPAILRMFIPASIRKQVKAGLNFLGIGRFSENMLEDRVNSDLAAISNILADKEFLFGEKACFADAAIVAQLAAMAATPSNTQAANAVKSNKNLYEYIARFQTAHYPKST
ncbi:MAG: glutathione S-transferase family protein, partial [Rhizobiaceae bacterium]